MKRSATAAAVLCALVAACSSEGTPGGTQSGSAMSSSPSSHATEGGPVIPEDSQSAGTGPAGGGGPVIPESSAPSSRNAACRSLPSARVVASAAGLDPERARLIDDRPAPTVACVLVVGGQAVARFGITQRDSRAALRRIGFRPDDRYPGVLRAMTNVAVTRGGRTYLISWDAEPADEKTVVPQEIAMLRAWGKL